MTASRRLLSSCLRLGRSPWRFVVIVVWATWGWLIVSSYQPSSTVKSALKIPVPDVNSHQSLPLDQPGDGVTFLEVAIAKGIDVNAFSWGLAWGDYNGDGFFDLYTNNHSQGPRLFLNNDGQSFTDITGETDLMDSDLHGPAWGDYDNDGDSDLYQSVGALRPNFFYQNNAGESLTNIAPALGVDHSGSGRGVAWADYDHDGDLDFFLTNLSRGGNQGELFQNQGDGTFIVKTDEAGLNGISGESQLWGDYNNDGWLDLLILSRPLTLFRNEGDGTFTDRSEILEDVQGSSDIDWIDYDNDGDLDLYTSRGTRNDGVAWNANEVGWNVNGDTQVQGFDIDLNSPGAPVTFENIFDLCGPVNLNDIFIGASGAHPSSIPFTLGDGQGPNPLGEPSNGSGIRIWVDGAGQWHFRTKDQRHNGLITTADTVNDVTPVNLDIDPVMGNRRNELWENLGNEVFENVSSQANVDDPRSSNSSVTGDFDNDGDLDLYVINGGYFLDNESNTYFVNNGDKTFTEATTSTNLTALVGGYGNVAATADYNYDGFLDIAVSNGAPEIGPCEGPLLLFENQGNSNHWLQIKTIGTQSNRDGIGAQLTVEVDGQRQYRPQHGGQHGNAQNSSPIHFGLGDATIVETLAITWSSGLTQTFDNVSVDQVLILVEGEELQELPPPPPPPSSSDFIFLPHLLNNFED